MSEDNLKKNTKKQQQKNNKQKWGNTKSDKIKSLEGLKSW